jgi:hypothetical protein
MNVEIGAEVALFPEKEYISGILFAVHGPDPDPDEYFIMILIASIINVLDLKLCDRFIDLFFILLRRLCEIVASFPSLSLANFLHRTHSKSTVWIFMTVSL